MTLFACVAAVALIQLIRSALHKADITYWKGIHVLVFAEGFCESHQQSFVCVSLLVFLCVVMRGRLRSANARSRLCAGRQCEFQREHALVATNTGRFDSVLCRGSLCAESCVCVFFFCFCAVASRNKTKRDKKFIESSLLWRQAIIITILIYWCKYYMRVFASEPHPTMRRVVRFYKWLLVFALLFEIAMR